MGAMMMKERRRTTGRNGYDHGHLHGLHGPWIMKTMQMTALLLAECSPRGPICLERPIFPPHDLPAPSTCGMSAWRQPCWGRTEDWGIGLSRASALC